MEANSSAVLESVDHSVLQREPITAEGKEEQIEALDRLFKSKLPGLPVLVWQADETVEVPMPAPVCSLLGQVVHYLAQKRAVSVVSLEQELTTQQAANLLNVSRPYLIRLLDQGDPQGRKLPYHTVGTHRRIRFDDLIKYKHERDGERRRQLQELAALSNDRMLVS